MDDELVANVFVLIKFDFEEKNESSLGLNFQITESSNIDTLRKLIIKNAKNQNDFEYRWKNIKYHMSSIPENLSILDDDKLLEYMSSQVFEKDDNHDFKAQFEIRLPLLKPLSKTRKQSIKKRKDMNKWTENEVLEWILEHRDLNEKYKKTICARVKQIGCDGDALLMAKSAEELCEFMEIKLTICRKLFSLIAADPANKQEVKCQYCGKTNHKENVCRKKKTLEMGEKFCDNCSKAGHEISECFFLLKKDFKFSGGGELSCSYCLKTRHTAETCRKKRAVEKGEKFCDVCSKVGHDQVDCYFLKKKKKQECKKENLKADLICSYCWKPKHSEDTCKVKQAVEKSKNICGTCNNEVHQKSECHFLKKNSIEPGIEIAKEKILGILEGQVQKNAQPRVEIEEPGKLMLNHVVPPEHEHVAFSLQQRREEKCPPRVRVKTIERSRIRIRQEFERRRVRGRGFPIRVRDPPFHPPYIEPVPPFRPMRGIAIENLRKNQAAALGCFFCKEFGHPQSRCRKKAEFENRPFCERCQIIGHFEKNCTKNINPNTYKHLIPPPPPPLPPPPPPPLPPVIKSMEEKREELQNFQISLLAKRQEQILMKIKEMNLQKSESEKEFMEKKVLWELELKNAKLEGLGPNEYYQKTGEADDLKLDDFDNVKNLFLKTFKCRLKEIIIENVVVREKEKVYEQLLRHKCTSLKRKRRQVEMLLWHGSSMEVLELIRKNGFDRSFSTVARYGRGTYFASDASYSARTRYSPKGPDGYQRMFLCKVIVGDMVQGSQSNQFMPKKENGDEYDSAVDDTKHPSIVVVWRDYVALPIKLLKFKTAGAF